MHSGMNDIDMLVDFEKDTRLAAVAYLSTAGEVRDPELKDLFLEFSRTSMKMQDKCTELINMLGGEF